MNILANSIRPKTIDDVLGQEHLIGKGKVLRNLIENKKCSLLFYMEHLELAKQPLQK